MKQTIWQLQQTIIGSLLTLIICASFFSISAARAETNIDRMKVMQVSGNGGTVFSLRLNELVNRHANPLAFDAEIDCNTVDWDLKIKLDGTIGSRREEFIFTDFDQYQDGVRDSAHVRRCRAVQKLLKKRYEANMTSCLVRISDTEVVVKDETACDAPSRPLR